MTLKLVIIIEVGYYKLKLIRQTGVLFDKPGFSLQVFYDGCIDVRRLPRHGFGGAMKLEKMNLLASR